MTDSLFDPEREGEEKREHVSDELLPDPGFASSLFDAPSEQESPRESGGISEETLFPADPVFSVNENDAPKELPCFDEPTSIAADSDATPIEPFDLASDPLDDSVALFDPIEETAEPSFDDVKSDDLDESLGLFRIPDADREEIVSTAAFYAASEVSSREENSEAPSESQMQGMVPEEKAKGETKKPARKKKVRAVRPLSAEDVLARRQDAERSIGDAKLRFCFAAFFTFLLAVVEILFAFGIRVTMPLGISRIPGAEALLDLQLLLLVALCAHPAVISGLRSIFGRRLRFEGLLLSVLLITVTYDIVLYAVGAREPVLYSLVLALSLTATVWLEISESRIALGILSVLSDEGGVSAALPSDDGKSLRVAHVAHADGFDEHIGDHEENGHLRFLLLLGVFVVGTLGLIASFVLEGKCNPLAVGLAAALLALPSGALMARRLYLSALQESLLLRQTALIGESAAYSAASLGVFSIDDAEAFDPDSLKIKIINVFGDFRLDEAVRLMAGVYRSLGGPLAEVLAKMCEEAGGPHEVSLVEVAKNGAVAHAGGKTVAVGTHDFMAENSIVFPSDAGQESILAGERLTILYCAVDGTVVSRLFVEYALCSSFENLADHLARLGTLVELRTADPCLSEEYLLRLSSLPRGVLSLRRVDVGELLSEKCTRVESCFFTADRPRSLIGAWLAFRRYIASRRRGEIMSVVQLLFGALLLGVSVFCFESPLLPIPLAALYHLLTVLVAVWGARAFKRRLSPDTESKGTES